jgi:hypothetical protein
MYIQRKENERSKPRAQCIECWWAQPLWYLYELNELDSNWRSLENRHMTRLPSDSWESRCKKAWAEADLSPGSRRIESEWIPSNAWGCVGWQRLDQVRHRELSQPSRVLELRVMALNEMKQKGSEWAVISGSSSLNGESPCIIRMHKFMQKPA